MEDNGLFIIIIIYVLVAEFIIKHELLKWRKDDGYNNKLDISYLDCKHINNNRNCNVQISNV